MVAGIVCSVDPDGIQRLECDDIDKAGRGLHAQNFLVVVERHNLLDRHTLHLNNKITYCFFCHFNAMEKKSDFYRLLKKSIFYTLYSERINLISYLTL